MAGKPTIPRSTHARIRKMLASGKTQAEVMRALDCSRYTVRKAIDPEFAESEKTRHRRLWPVRHLQRKSSPEYQERAKAYADCDTYRAAVRERMRALRAKRAAQHTQ